MDTEIGRLLDSLDPDTLANTNIIFIGDNGTPNNTSTDFERGAKGQLYQGGVHVPFIVSGPSVNGPLNRTQDSPIHVVDIFETVLELGEVNLDTAVPDTVTYDSVSIVDYLTDANQENLHTFSYTEGFRDPTGNNDGATITNNDYKFIRFNSNGNEELYHISNDPLETTDLNTGTISGTDLENLNALRDELDAFQSSED